MNISVIIPAINEASNIGDAIDNAWNIGALEVIVVDGGSSDDTLDIARAVQCQAIQTAPGRGPQQNAGAAVARGEVLLFLHADTRLDPACGKQIRQAFESDRKIVAGGFRQQISNQAFPYRWLETGNAWRIRWQKLVYGDQGLFVRKSTFQAIGGFPDYPMMEDFELSRRLRRQGNVVILEGPIQIDARRWESNGVLRQTLRNWTLVSLFRCGVTPEKLARHYRPHSRADTDAPHSSGT